MGRSPICAKVAAGTSPWPIKQGSSSVWVDTEVRSWIDALIESRDQQRAA